MCRVAVRFRSGLRRLLDGRTKIVRTLVDACHMQTHSCLEERMQAATMKNEAEEETENEIEAGEEDR